jgi:hypothetical protein
MNINYEAPFFNNDAFTCPHCNAFAAMHWHYLQLLGISKPIQLKLATCHRCGDFSIWRVTDNYNSGTMVYPTIQIAPLPNSDLPQNCMQDYLEARVISNNSPRGAAALLRLCIQKLCVDLGGNGKNINGDISKLVENGLPITIQKALDIVRVIGNNAVHPGEISVADQPETVFALFNLVNLIVDNQITQPKQVSELFNTLPDGAKDAIDRRDR